MKIWQIILICGGLMLVGINQSLWLDEAISVKVAREFSYSDIVTQFSIHDFHPPLYYLTLKTWAGVFGYSAISLRTMSIAFAILTIYLVYKMAGTGAALLSGFNPLFIYYSQEIRMYLMVTALLMLVLYFFKLKKYLWVNVFAFLAFLTFYGSIFFLAALGLYLLVNKRYSELIISNIGILMAIIVVSPLLSLQLQNSQEMLNTVKNWSLVLGKANIKNLLLIPMKFTSGRISFYPKILYYLISGTFAIFVFSKLFKRNLDSFMFWMTLMIGVIFSIFTPMLQYFRFLYLIPVMAMVINKNRTIMVGFLIFSLFYLTNQNMHREDWKTLVANLGEKAYMIQSFEDPVKFYKPNIVLYDIRNMIFEKNITIIPYGEEIHGVNHNDLLAKQGFSKIKETSYRGLTTENWTKD